MWRDAALNVDGMPLEADHEVARAAGNTGEANRLMLAVCNRSTGSAWRAAQASSVSRDYVDPHAEQRKYWSREW